MKLKVYLKNHVLIEADTIDALKASIMDVFELTAGDLSQRLLVRDNRELLVNRGTIITGCVDLLQLPDGSILDELDLCNDGDTLVLGWKGSCIVRLVTDFILKEGHNIEFDNSFTLRQLKLKIEMLTGESVTKDNLPQLLFNVDDDEKPLLFFGYYRIWPLLYNNRGFDFQIHRDKNNMPVSKYPIMSMEKRDANGNKYFCHFREPVSFRSKEAYNNYIAMRRVEGKHQESEE